MESSVCNYTFSESLLIVVECLKIKLSNNKLSSIIFIKMSFNSILITFIAYPYIILFYTLQATIEIQ